MREQKKEYTPKVLNLEIFEDFANSLDASIDSALKTAHTQKKEVVSTVKLTIDTSERVDNDTMLKWTEPHVDYKVVRTIKESKFDYAGAIKKAAMKIIDGHVFIESMDEKDGPVQMSFFDIVDEKYHV